MHPDAAGEKEEDDRRKKLDKNHIFRNVASIDLVVKKEVKETIFDREIKEWGVEHFSELELKNLDFNETIALTCGVMGTDKVCNISAAVMFGHTQGNPKYIKDFANFLKNEPNSGR